MNKICYNFDDFTEQNYRELIQIAKEKYEFIPFRDYKKRGQNLLMRHDVDFSVHRAYALAKIEAEEGVHSTYFLWPHCKYYNLFEDEIVSIVEEIIKMGHDIGLHFDYDFYKKRNRSVFYGMVNERQFMEHSFDVKPKSFSFHNITKTADEMYSIYTCEKYCSMINAHSQYIRNTYEYCSDSNGYWRFKRLRDVLEQPVAKNLHVLTHPEWWTPEILSPRDRITRCIDGRNKDQHAWYDGAMEETGRLNIR